MSEDQQTYKRAVTAALAGLAVQLLVALALLLTALWAANPALTAATWYAFGGLGLWVCLLIVFKQHALERIEALEAEQLARRHGADSSIFETTADDLLVARRRLQRLYRWFVPAVSILTSAYLLGVGLWLFADTSARFGAETGRLAERAAPLALMFICGAVAFVAFLVSRYVAGMARHRHWQLLRGGAAYLMGVALVAGLLTLGMFAIAAFEALTLLHYLAVVVPVVMGIVGAEIALNFVLDLYRPRRPDQAPRPAFDSRLLSLLTAPESIARTINEAINYQFGFEITRSWFWQLLSRASGYLAAFALLVLLAMSCLVIVEPNQRALVTRFGQLVHGSDRPPLGPGLHLKLPWPLSNAQTYDVLNIRAMRIGSDIQLKEDVPILWSNEHTEKEPEKLIVAAPPYLLEQRGEGPEQTSAPSVSLVNAEITLHYRIGPDRLIEYVLANSDEDDPERRDQRLRSIALQQASRYMMRHHIDEWIGTARTEAGDRLRRIIQDAADRARLGVEVVNVVVASVHPPREVADTFHRVIGAEQEKQQKKQQALKDKAEILAKVAGSADVAELILTEYEAAQAMQRRPAPADQTAERRRRIEQMIRDKTSAAAEQVDERLTAETLALAQLPLGDAEDPRVIDQRRRIENLAQELGGGPNLLRQLLAEARLLYWLRQPPAPRKRVAEQEQLVEALVREAGGEAAELIADARAYRWTKENLERGEAERFASQLEAYRAAPNLYRMRMLFDVLAAELGRARKYILASDYGDLVLRGDFKDLDASAFTGMLEATDQQTPRP